jgi:hypothetical protein
VHRYYNTLLHGSKPLCEYPKNPNIAIVNGFMCARTDEEALEKAAGWTFFIFALSYYGRKGVDAPGTSNLWGEYQEWRKTEKAQAALRNGLIGSPETIRKRLRQFADAQVDQVILLNQAGRTTHQDICESLELFAKEVMPEFHAREGEHQKWKGTCVRQAQARGARYRRVRPLLAPERGHRAADAGAAESPDGRQGEGQGERRLGFGGGRSNGLPLRIDDGCSAARLSLEGNLVSAVRGGRDEYCNRRRWDLRTFACAQSASARHSVLRL